MKNLSQWKTRRMGCIVADAFEVKKEIPEDKDRTSLRRIKMLKKLLRCAPMLVLVLSLLPATSFAKATVAAKPVKNGNHNKVVNDIVSGFQVLHNFAGPTGDGDRPYGGPIEDAAGNLYGTTTSGGTSGGSYGVIWKIDTTGTESVLYNFTNGTDGVYPYGSLVVDSSGNLYGTTFEGGSGGYGTVFKLDTTNTLTTLHAFSYSDGAYPVGGVFLDR